MDYLSVSLTNKEIERLFSRITVDHDDPLGKCWEWTRSVSTDGYAQISFRGNYHKSVHRILYAWLIEPIPEGYGKDIPVLDHFVCDNPRCVNPFHLRQTTNKINILRGSGPPAINARKTHCAHGHLLPAVPNRMGKGRSGRECLICRKEYADNDEYRRKAREREWKKRHPE